MSWKVIRSEIVEILKSASRYENGETCYLSAYQIAVLLYKNQSLIQGFSGPKNIGGKGEGKHTSLSQYIAKSLSNDIDKGLISIERAFFNTYGLKEFLFLDEKGVTKEPSNECFSMFRYRP